MSSKKQLLILISAFISVLLLIASVNYYFDPFGAFNKKDGWFSYQMTRNPRTAKISYLNNNYFNYDSYILGSSGASALVTSSFKDGKYYNLFFYGADMKDIKQTAYYIADNYEVKNVILPITFSFAENYGEGEGKIDFNMKPEITKQKRTSFYLQYLFANLFYVKEMWNFQNEDGYLPKPFDVFIPETGNYDKRVRSVEKLGSSEEYLAKYPDFGYEKQKLKMPYMDEFFGDLKDVLYLFKKRGIKYKVIMYPLYKTSYQAYDEKDVQRFLDKLSNITDFYDFTYSSISCDPRYFYDTGHYRNDVGDMMIRKIYGKAGYIPEDFGTYVKKGTKYAIKEPMERNLEHSIKVLILHHIGDNAYNSNIITEKRLIELFDTIKRKGYKVIRMKDVANYVKEGKQLPEKSVMLTFDDGYLSNYTKLFPLLKKYEYPAVFFPIGVSIGKDKYKNTGENIIPHYSLEHIKIMNDSGLVEFGTHGFDIHQSEKFEKATARTSILKFEEESEEEYIKFLKSDFDKFDGIFKGVGIKINAMAYPLGKHDELSDVITLEEGIEISFTTNGGDNYLLKGLHQSMFNMNRTNVDMYVDLEKILN